MSNPLTCRHNIVTTIVNVVSLEQWFVCVSCNSPTPVEWLKARGGSFGVYDYDPEERVWVYKAKGASKGYVISDSSDEKTLPGPAMVVLEEMPWTPNESYEEFDFFIDIQEGEEQVYEYRKVIRGFAWHAIVVRSTWSPRGRRVSKPMRFH